MKKRHIIKIYLFIILTILLSVLLFKSNTECEEINNKNTAINKEETRTEKIKIDENIKKQIDTVTIANQLYLDKMNELPNTDDKEKWFIEYKELINKYNDILYNADLSLYENYTSDELEKLFGVVQAEIGDEYSFEQKCNVASVIFNRINHEQFGNSIDSVLTPSQFSTIRNGRYKTVKVSETTKLACEYAFTIGDTTNGCLFFDSNGVLKYKFVFNDNAHNFYKLHN